MISIIIPSRNRAELAAKALAGIQMQSYGDYEVIMVDDGSNAGTRLAYQTIWENLDHRFRIIYASEPAERGSGPSTTRNLGVRESRGDVIAFCDDDDFWCDPEHLSRVAHAFYSTPELDIYIGNQRAVDVDGHTKADWLPDLIKLTAGKESTEHGTVIVGCDELCRSGGFAHLNILSLRKNLVENIHGFWERISYEEDRDFFWRAVDRALLINFNPAVIAQHNVPDRTRTANLSTAHSSSERLMFSLLVSQHILSMVRNRSIARLAGSYCGDLLRRLSLSASKTGQSHAALQLAKQALAARFSAKWALYVATLTFKSIVVGRRA